MPRSRSACTTTQFPGQELHTELLLQQRRERVQKRCATDEADQQREAKRIIREPELPDECGLLQYLAQFQADQLQLPLRKVVPSPTSQFSAEKLALPLRQFTGKTVGEDQTLQVNSEVALWKAFAADLECSEIKFGLGE